MSSLRLLWLGMKRFYKLFRILHLLHPSRLPGSERLDTRRKLRKGSIVQNTSFDNDNVWKRCALGPHSRAASAAKLAEGWIATATLYFISCRFARDDLESRLRYDPIGAECRSSALLAIVAVTNALCGQN
jgi:hypothetical protein